MLRLRSSRRAIRVRPLFLGMCFMCGLALLSAGCGSGDPFSYVQVSGKLTYEDGSLIPAETIILIFTPQQEAINSKTHPRPGSTTINKTTGEFRTVTSHKYGDGLVRGKHKVTLLSGDYQRLPAKLVPAEYYDTTKTPLEVDTSQQPFHLKVRKP